VSDSNRVEPTGAPERASAPGAARQIIEFIATLAVAFLVAQAVRIWIIQPYIVPTGSMLPTIQLGDQVLANKFIYRFQQPERPDIVVLDDPTGEVGTLIKRVIAVGGQTVDLQNGHVVVDGVPLDESYTHGQTSEPLMGSSIKFPLKIPVGDIWVMGDNRTQSQDSRWFGPVPLSSVHGKAFYIYWPISRFGPLR
jgi:signal peptidase I